MDFIFHGVSNIALQKTIQKETPKKRRRFLIEAFLWGALPDLIPFTIPVIISLFKGISFWAGENPEMLAASAYIYQYTHSLIVFIVVFFLVRLFTKKWYLPMLGWALHILFDIPLHEPDYFATPFLFPLSSWTLPFGVSWATWWIFFPLWGFLIVWLIWLKKNKKHS